MKKKLLLIPMALILFYPFYFITLNQLVNLLQPIDKSCLRDSDCKMYKTECHLCNFYSKGQAVNKNYQPFCPLPRPYFFNCTKEAPSWQKTYTAVCENTTCTQKQSVEEPNLILAKNWFEDL